MLEPTTISDRIYREMRELIVAGELPPGARLVQRQLAQRFQASSIPVLEAIRRLERDGLVRSHPHFGAEVETWSREDIEGAYLLREALEGVACRLFSERADNLERLTLAEYGRQYAQAVQSGDLRAASEVDIALHQHITHGVRSRIFSRLAGNSSVITTTILNASRLRDTGKRTQALLATVHDDLIAALLTRDPTAAEQAGKAHVRKSMQLLLADLHEIEIGA